MSWTEDVVVGWAKPTLAGGDVLNGFVYKWNTSITSLDDTALNSTANDGMFNQNVDPPTLTKAAADFTNDDSNLLRYLHVKTWYLDISAKQPAYSSDVVVGPINIDNVAPAGTVRITDDSGNDISETSSSPLDLRLSASLAPVTMYLSETSTRPSTGAAYSSEVTYTLGNATPGSKTIYAWFEDGVGNISTAPATDTVTLLAPAISPYEATLDLSTVTTQVFAVEGNSDPYDWTIIEETPDTALDDVADFSGGATGMNSVTVTLLKPGTFKLQATPSAGGTALTSGTITLTGGTLTITISFKTGLNVVPFTMTGSGITTAAELDAAIVAANPGVSVSQIFGWDGANQRFGSPYINFGVVTTGDFTIVEGNGYFVQVDGDASYNLVGNDYTTLTLYTGLNIVGVPYGKAETITDTSLLDAELLADAGLTVAQVFGWDAVNQRFGSPYINFGVGTTGNFNLNVESEAYFIQVSGDGTYTP
ncbi:hypothetical protein ACFL9U_12650 [Thermodesulfobacteriota bacterium]